MNKPDQSDVVVVTGAGRGLGSDLAQKFAANRYKVLVTDLDTSRIDETVELIRTKGGVAEGGVLDVCKKSDFESTLAKALSLWGRADVLINNAGMTRTTSLFDISPEEFSQIVDVNMRGTFLGCQVFGKYFSEEGYGRIVNLASLAAQNGGAATGAHYAASKGGIVTLTKVFARDLAKKGVTVNAISPGPLDVELVREILPPEKLEAVTQSIPVGRLGNPNFIADIALLMASRSAASMTGSTVDCNGGLYVR
ncbi:SDR family NAD(P)-dependent oxidoreductase [Hirschia litorea]|uniref:SDR family NAD(P)-dependent oxidoreductase n=1 Tax=Hirschia litorea TaxID=1199156 RepID=A0ABW2IKN2_9PROT